jgi:hypothetical protein
MRDALIEIVVAFWAERMQVSFAKAKEVLEA